ncbi:OmpA family protein [Stappia sp. BW2]|uniref:OmpA family protein n=1 Tax=Stappia sp. BW2 TaxID=2592622 RepID=UPI0013969528|nr:OmpA family protein [Stappia sp. BW2]
MALVLAIGLPLQPDMSRAQETAVDCAANPDQEACRTEEAAPSGEANSGEAPAAPASEEGAFEAPAPESASESAPETAPEAAPEAAQEPAPEVAPEATQDPQPAESADTEEAQPEAKPAAPVEEAKPAEKPAAPVEDAAPAEKPQNTEEMNTEETNAEETATPDAKPEAPTEEAAPTKKPAVEPSSEQTDQTGQTDAASEASTAEQPAEEQPADDGSSTEAGQEETSQSPDTKADSAAAEEPAAEETTAEEGSLKSAGETEPAAAAVAEPASEEVAPEQTDAEQKATDQKTTEQKTAEPVQADTLAAPDASSDAAPVAATAADETVTDEPGELIDAQAAAPADEPAAVVSDDATDAQRAEVKAKEERRRDEARDRRLELLGAAAVGVGVGMLIPALGGKVVEDQGDRIIVERDGEYFVRKDESSLLRYGDDEFRAERLRGGRTRETVTRRNGVKIVTIRDEGGYVLYRSRLLPDGREYVLIDNRQYNQHHRNYDRELPPLQVGIPRDRYVVPAGRANYDDIYQTFTAPPVEQVEQAYSLRDIRESERLRDKVRRVDLDTITFDTGSAVVRQSQVPQLEDLARASQALIEQDPTTVLLIEGHTDAVGSDVSNLALSDRRAETVARILADFYGVAPENMVVQGYGEDYLKVDTQGAEERNRRVTIRNITPLLSARKQ